MTIAEFVLKLKRFTKRNKVQWKLSDNAIRTPDGLCPIEALARVGPCQFQAGAKKLKLIWRQTNSITAAADNVFASTRLRQQLLEATDLTELAARNGSIIG